MTEKEKLDEIRGQIQPLVTLIDKLDKIDCGFPDLIKDCKDSINKICESKVFKDLDNEKTI